jgi:hypothetical protein
VYGNLQHRFHLLPCHRVHAQCPGHDRPMGARHAVGAQQPRESGKAYAGHAQSAGV